MARQRLETEVASPNDPTKTKRGTKRKGKDQGGARRRAGRPAWYPPRGRNWTLMRIAQEYAENGRPLREIGPLVGFGNGPGARNRVSWFVHHEFWRRLRELQVRDPRAYEDFTAIIDPYRTTANGRTPLDVYRRWLEEIADGGIDVGPLGRMTQ